ncbi:uncharacterized protein LOC125487081 [Rhincodon typus]|uniref:uncharacterized protein LOC125487081 n=1 Tax=Rhincodon typus TaxID=259920 RepID=UPI002030B316|nr:uncharacterized protein LOC125487081 [Rhincodon typus]
MSPLLILLSGKPQLPVLDTAAADIRGSSSLLALPTLGRDAIAATEVAAYPISSRASRTCQVWSHNVGCGLCGPQSLLLPPAVAPPADLQKETATEVRPEARGREPDNRRLGARRLRLVDVTALQPLWILKPAKQKMLFKVLVSCTFIVMCSTHVHHKHEPVVSEDHYMDGEHNPEFDREVLFGGEKEVGELAKLSPEEQQARLKTLIKKMDLDADGFVTKAELSGWIQQSFKHYATEESKEQFPEHDLDGNGVVTWEEYNIHSYDRMLDYDENTPLADEEEESLRQVRRKFL